VRNALVAKGLASERLFLAAPKLHVSGEGDASWAPRAELSLAAKMAASDRAWCPSDAQSPRRGLSHTVLPRSDATLMAIKMCARAAHDHGHNSVGEAIVVASRHNLRHTRGAPAAQRARASRHRLAAHGRDAIGLLAWLARLLRGFQRPGRVVGSFEHIDGAELQDGSFRASDSLALGSSPFTAFADTVPVYGRYCLRQRSMMRAQSA
jgi:hypothetical protein